MRSMSMIEQELEDLEEAGAAWNLKWGPVSIKYVSTARKRWNIRNNLVHKGCPLQGAQGSVFRVHQVDVS